jgi:chromosome segregation ATPase
MLVNGVECISVKDYAEKQGISVSAVLQSLHGKRNKSLLQGHIHREDGSNKQWLDEEAVRILDSGRKKSPVIIDSKEAEARHTEELAAKDQIIEELRERIKELSLTNQNISETLKNVSSAKALLEDKATKYDALALQADNLKNEKSNLKLEVTELQNKVDALKKRSLWQRIRNKDV